MMNQDVSMSAAIAPEELSKKFELQEDERLNRDPIKDLHDAIDLAMIFSAAINKMHPEASAHIRYLILGGKFL